MNQHGKLYLLPVPVTPENGMAHIPSYNIAIIRSLNYFIVEDLRSGRRFLKQCGYESIDTAGMMLLNEHSKEGKIADLLAPLMKGQSAGLMSDAGCPGIADPGAELIQLAHDHGIGVVPLVGPSAIVLSIMSSGFNGQNFAFVGYLPVDRSQRERKIKELEQLSARQKQAQFFIETPYRNRQMLESLLSALSPSTRLFVGKDLLGPGQMIKSATVTGWKKTGIPELGKVPAVFGIYAL